MKKTLLKLMLATTALLGFSASATPITDVQDYSNNTATEYFVDLDSNKTSDPYYRDSSEDWSWVHNAISGSSFSSILLDISAYDVDTPDEIDTISVYDGSSWLDLGILLGLNDIWAFTSYDLSSFSWAEAQVNAGLQVKIDIDTNSEGWAVTLAKSTLTIDGGNLECVPTPGIPCTTVDVPESSTLALLGLGLIGIGIRRRKVFTKL